MTEVVNRRTEKETIYIGRGSPLGNPFGVGAGRDRCIQVFRIYLFQVLQGGDPRLCAYKLAYQRNTSVMPNWVAPTREEILEALRGIKSDDKLGCYCKPQPCHGDVIVSLLGSDYWREMDG